ncbi:MAG: T9SS type A sorting domain-containing protein [Saprospiraceae bacterium]
MKKTLLTIFSFALMITLGFSQTFSDDFEGYNVGDYLGSSAPEWTTWDGSVGGASDVKIVDDKANSGTKSIKFSSVAANGGPQDVVLYFGDNKLTTGQLDFSTAIYVGTGAYFNFQAEKTIGTTWAMNAFFEANGVGRITGSGNETLVNFNYPMGEWFDFKMTVNFDANKWSFDINGVCAGSFSNPNNSIASIDIFPLSGNSFYIDDFSYEYNEESPEILNDAKFSLTASEENGLVGTKTDLKGVIGNAGTTAITSFEVEMNVDGTTTPVTVDNVTIEQGAAMEFVIADAYEIREGFAEVSAMITSINDGNFNDEDLCNDSGKVFLFGSVPAPHKKVIVEEATGTWCGWCPRGTVALEKMSHKYPDRFIGIAVHNGDPMVVEDYDTGLNASGYPNALVNRGAFMDPSVIETPFLGAVKEPSIASMIQGASWNAASRELRISVILKAEKNISTNHKINVVLTEDDVEGTGSSWKQANYFSGAQDLISYDGTNWRDLPANVTTDYDHVARAMLAPYTGLENSFTEDLNVNDEKVFNFSYAVSSDFDITKMHIVTMIINPDGTIDTGESNSIEEAEENGYTETTGIEDIVFGNAVNIYPNPFSNYTNVSINLPQTTDVNIKVSDMTGKILREKNYTNQSGYFTTKIDGTALPAGVYLIHINSDNANTTKRISIVK